MPNGEIVGLRIAEGGSASNEGKTYQRYSLRGSWYEISAVDAANNRVSSYGLNDAVEVCIPLPDALRSKISDLAIVAINADDSLTILSSIVRISSSGTNVCGSLSSVPATGCRGHRWIARAVADGSSRFRRHIRSSGHRRLRAVQQRNALGVDPRIGDRGFRVRSSARSTSQNESNALSAPTMDGFRARRMRNHTSTTQFNGLNARRQGKG